MQSLVALGFLAYMTWGLVWSATYVAALYGGLGRGVAAGADSHEAGGTHADGEMVRSAV